MAHSDTTILSSTKPSTSTKDVLNMVHRTPFRMRIGLNSPSPSSSRCAPVKIGAPRPCIMSRCARSSTACNAPQSFSSVKRSSRGRHRLSRPRPQFGLFGSSEVDAEVLESFILCVHHSTVSLAPCFAPPSHSSLSGLLTWPTASGLAQSLRSLSLSPPRSGVSSPLLSYAADLGDTPLGASPDVYLVFSSCTFSRSSSSLPWILGYTSASTIYVPVCTCMIL
ncbi:hypothetical protein BD413DRAFT_65184 [Trametes elegans]|nr:hypothetical protein BD413DRAFT_65184 [Trametes elegans]